MGTTNIVCAVNKPIIWVTTYPGGATSHETLWLLIFSSLRLVNKLTEKREFVGNGNDDIFLDTLTIMNNCFSRLNAIEFKIVLDKWLEERGRVIFIFSRLPSQYWARISLTLNMIRPSKNSTPHLRCGKTGNRCWIWPWCMLVTIYNSASIKGYRYYSTW